MAEKEMPGVVSAVLDDLERAGVGERVSVREIVEQMGDRSFAPLLLVPALITVSPISGIPGTPTVAALIIALIVVQMIAGRKSLWLPRFLRECRVSSRRMEQAVGFLKRPVGRVERLISPRLSFLTDRPVSYLVLLTCLAISGVMPLMEFVPMLASVSAVAISLFAVGLLARDGLFVIAGYGVVGGGLLVARAFIQAAQDL